MSPEPDPTPTPAPENDPAPAPEPELPPAAVDDPLGDAGKRALEAERLARKDSDRRAKALEAELDELRKGQMSEQERAVADAHKAGATEAIGKVQDRLFAAEVRAAAAGRVADTTLLSDPDVARKLLGLEVVPVDSDGNIDTEAISGAIDRMVTERPFLAAAAGATPPPKPTGSADGGARGSSTPSQFGRADLQSMTPEQITKAKADGRLNDLLGIS